MSDTLWTERAPGDLVGQGTDDPTILVIGGNVPDWVRTPPGLPDIAPNVVLKVVRAFGAPCPKCKNGPDVQHIQVEQGWSIAECSVEGHGFVWYK